MASQVPVLDRTVVRPPICVSSVPPVTLSLALSHQGREERTRAPFGARHLSPLPAVHLPSPLVGECRFIPMPHRDESALSMNG